MIALSACLAIAAALIAVTLVYTYAKYDDLPPRIPIHFGFTAVPDGYGPKVAAWLIPAVQVAMGVLACYLTVSAAGASSPGLYVAVMTLASALITLLAAQWLIIETAMNGPSSSRYRRFWLIFAVTLCAGWIAPVLFSR